MAIFRSTESLSPNYPIEDHWDEIPHRSEQVRYLWNFYGDILEKRGESYLRRLQIIGPAGSGKTCTLRFFGERFVARARERGIDLDHLYINLKLETGRKVVLYRNLLGKVDPGLVSASLSAGEMVRILVDYLRDSGRRLLLTVDEIDYYVRHYRDEGVVYDLTRLNELTLGRPCGVVGVTFLARDRGFHDLLDVAELSTLGRAFVPFEPYSSEQVYDILERRAREAFNPGAYSSEVLELISDITANPPVNGDVRYALDILLYSGNLAENRGADRILPEHVRRVYGETHHLITTEDVLSLPDKDKVVLLGVVRALMSRRSSYASLREIREMVGVVCEEFGLRPVEDMDECVQDLCDRGIIDLKSLLQMGVSGLPAADLDRFLNKTIERLKSGINERGG